MALIKCKECGDSISSDAKICPHCGKNQHRTGCLSKFFIAIIIIGVLGAVVSILTNDLTPKINVNTFNNRMTAFNLSQDYLRSIKNKIKFDSWENSECTYNKWTNEFMVVSKFYLTSWKGKKLTYGYVALYKYYPNKKYWEKTDLKSQSLN